MSLKEYNYSNPKQKLLAASGTYLSFLLMGFLLSNCIFISGKIFYYGTNTIIITLIAMTIMLIGNLTGKLLFSLFSNSRTVYAVVEMLFVITFIVFIARGYIYGKSDINIFLTSIRTGSVFIVTIISLPVFLTGIKINYFLKICSGLFIDEKHGISYFVSAFISGILTGIGLFLTYFRMNIPYISILLFLLFIFPLIFFIKEKYRPQNFLADNISEDSTEDTDEKKEYRDDIFFTYLNFSCIIIYLFLGSLLVEKFIGLSNYTEFYYFLTVSVSILFGYIISSFFQRNFWHIYSEMLFPFLFFMIYLMMAGMTSGVQKNLLMLCFIPLGFVFGFSIFHSLKSILNRYNHKNSYTVINISFFILPLPILAALFLITFTSKWFFLIFYSVAFLNLLLPGIHLTQRPIREYKKGIYFIVILITIPFFILSHMYFKIAFDDKLFIIRSSNYDSIYNINYNSDYISDSFNIMIDGKSAVEISDRFYHDIKQSVAAIDLIIHDSSSKFLFLDGYRKFIYNSNYGNFRDSILLDYLPGEFIDFKNFPVSGEKEIITIKGDMFRFLYKNRNAEYDSIVMIPNLMEQDNRYVMFSDEFLSLMKDSISNNGYLALILDAEKINPVLLNSTFNFIKRNFKKTIVFNFSSQLLIISSDNSEAFMLTEQKLRRINTIIDRTDNLFYDEIDFLSNITLTDLSVFNFITTDNNSGKMQLPLFTKKISTSLNPDNYLLGNMLSQKFMKLSDSADVSSYLERKKTENRQIYETLFNARKFNRHSKYAKELTAYTELKKTARNNTKLSDYLDYILQIKKLNYGSLAEKSEKNKEWDKAKELYNAILAIEPDNFNAIYKLSMISITIQDLEKAFEYLSKALELNHSNTDVMYHMGVLLFAKQDYKKSQYYLNMAVSNNRSDAMTFFYLGMTYEQMGEYYNFLNARKYYKIALSKNPNNDDINAAFFRIEETIRSIESAWTSRTEQKNGETAEQVPLPVTEKALNSRLNDE